MLRKFKKNVSRPVGDKYINEEGECNHCGVFIGDKDSRVLNSQGHKNGSCILKRQELVAYRSPRQYPAKRPRSTTRDQGDRVTTERRDSIEEGVGAAGDRIQLRSDATSPVAQQGGSPIHGAQTHSGDTSDESHGVSSDTGPDSSGDDILSGEQSSLAGENGGDIDMHGGDHPMHMDPSDETMDFGIGFQDYFAHDRASRPPRTVRDYQALLHQPIHEGAAKNLLEWLIDTVELRGSMSRDTFDKSFKLHLECYVQPNICPPTWHMCKRVLGITDFDSHIHHFCPCGSTDVDAEAASDASIDKNHPETDVS